MVNILNMKTTIHGVLAGAYQNRNAKSMLTHASTDGAQTALCKRVKEYSLCDQEEDGPPTCSVCAKRLGRLS